jgi:MFS family permease
MDVRSGGAGGSGATAACSRRWWALAVVCAAVFIGSIDNLILNLALPTLVRDLGTTTTELQWIIDGYALVHAGLLLVGGTFGDRFGRARMLRIGLVIFGVGSAIAAWSTSAMSLISGRAIMGVAASLTIPASLAIITNVFEDPENEHAPSACGPRSRPWASFSAPCSEGCCSITSGGARSSL